MVKVVELYGGAITTIIPEGFLDVSLLREVPDTQEVYVNSREDTEVFNDGLGKNESVIVDLLESVDADSDEEALRIHMAELSDLNDSEQWAKIKDTKPIANSQCCLLVESAKKWGKSELNETVAICLALIRLDEFQTDVVITINIPLEKENFTQASISAHHNITAAYQLLLEMVKQFKIVDESLFA